MTVQIFQGDAAKKLAELPDGSVDCVVTSPPYFIQRDYRVAGQIGMERHPTEFVGALVTVFDQVRRVLRDEGVVWVNLGDTMNNRRRVRSSSHQPSLNGFKEQSWAEATRAGLTRLSINDGDLKEKDAFGIPWAFAFAMRKSGWFLRQEIIWHKTFGKPEPSTDKLPNRHEQLFLFSKSKRHYFSKDQLPTWAVGSVWSIAPTGSKDHGAAFPEALVLPCILAGCPPNGTVLDPFGGSGTTGVVAARLGRNCILIELNQEYAATARKRTAQAAFSNVS